MQVRAGDRSLAPTRHMREMRTKQLLELLERQLALVERVVLTRRLAVEPAIWSGDDKDAVLSENPRHFVEYPLLVLYVLDDLEGDHRAEGTILEGREVERAAHMKLEVGATVVELAVLDRPLVDVNADHVGC